VAFLQSRGTAWWGSVIGMHVPNRNAVSSDDQGQSLVEIALALPFLLLLLLGLADFGRAFFYTSAIANAARVGAQYIAYNAPALSGDAQANAKITQRVCDETGFAPFGTSCGAVLGVTASPSPPVSGADVTVTVTYDFDLLSAYLVGRIVGSDPVRLRAVATYPGLS
jgi:Flp pilus assembly protein TadG